MLTSVGELDAQDNERRMCNHARRDGVIRLEAHTVGASERGRRVRDTVTIVQCRTGE